MREGWQDPIGNSAQFFRIVSHMSGGLFRRDRSSVHSLLLIGCLILILQQAHCAAPRRSGSGCVRVATIAPSLGSTLLTTQQWINVTFTQNNINVLGVSPILLSTINTAYSIGGIQRTPAYIYLRDVTHGNSSILASAISIPSSKNSISLRFDSLPTASFFYLVIAKGFSISGNLHGNDFLGSLPFITAGGSVPTGISTTLPTQQNACSFVGTSSTLTDTDYSLKQAIGKTTIGSCSSASALTGCTQSLLEVTTYFRPSGPVRSHSITLSGNIVDGTAGETYTLNASVTVNVTKEESTWDIPITKERGHHAVYLFSEVGVTNALSDTTAASLILLEVTADIAQQYMDMRTAGSVSFALVAGTDSNSVKNIEGQGSWGGKYTDNSNAANSTTLYHHSFITNYPSWYVQFNKPKEGFTCGVGAARNIDINWSNVSYTFMSALHADFQYASHALNTGSQVIDHGLKVVVSSGQSTHMIAGTVNPYNNTKHIKVVTNITALQTDQSLLQTTKLVAPEVRTAGYPNDKERILLINSTYFGGGCGKIGTDAIMVANEANECSKGKYSCLTNQLMEWISGERNDRLYKRMKLSQGLVGNMSTITKVPRVRLTGNSTVATMLRLVYEETAISKYVVTISDSVFQWNEPNVTHASTVSTWRATNSAEGVRLETHLQNTGIVAGTINISTTCDSKWVTASVPTVLIQPGSSVFQNVTWSKTAAFKGTNAVGNVTGICRILTKQTTHTHWKVSKNPVSTAISHIPLYASVDSICTYSGVQVPAYSLTFGAGNRTAAQGWRSVQGSLQREYTLNLPKNNVLYRVESQCSDERNASFTTAICSTDCNINATIRGNITVQQPWFMTATSYCFLTIKSHSYGCFFDKQVTHNITMENACRVPSLSVSNWKWIGNASHPHHWQCAVKDLEQVAFPSTSAYFQCTHSGNTMTSSTFFIPSIQPGATVLLSLPALVTSASLVGTCNLYPQQRPSCLIEGQNSSLLVFNPDSVRPSEVVSSQTSAAEQGDSAAENNLLFGVLTTNEATAAAVVLSFSLFVCCMVLTFALAAVVVITVLCCVLSQHRQPAKGLSSTLEKGEICPCLGQGEEGAYCSFCSLYEEARVQKGESWIKSLEDFDLGEAIAVPREVWDFYLGPDDMESENPMGAVTMEMCAMQSYLEALQINLQEPATPTSTAEEVKADE